MKQNIEETKFESVVEELKYEIQDVIDLLNHILGVNKTEPNVINLICDYVQRPANDNWPLIENKNKKNIKVNVF